MFLYQLNNYFDPQPRIHCRVTFVGFRRIDLASSHQTEMQKKRKKFYLQQVSSKAPPLLASHWVRHQGGLEVRCRCKDEWPIRTKCGWVLTSVGELLLLVTESHNGMTMVAKLVIISPLLYQVTTPLLLWNILQAKIVSLSTKCLEFRKTSRNKNAAVWWCSCNPTVTSSLLKLK